MPKQLTAERKAAGLHTLPNPYTLPEGALLEAKNVSIDRDGVIEKARGFRRYRRPTIDTSFGETVAGVFELDGSIFAVGEDGEIFRSSSGDGWGAILAVFYERIPGYRARVHKVRSAGLLPGGKGIVRFEGLFHRGAGVHPALYTTIETADPGEQTAKVVLPAESQVSYRIVYKKVHSDGSFTLSAPSPRHIVQNIGMDPLDVRIRARIPTWATAVLPRELSFQSDHILFFRTPHSDLLTDPGDEHFLVREITVGGPDWNDFIDDIDEAFLSDPLYTNPTEETIGAANYPPPLAHDIDTHRGHTFYARTRQPHEIRIRLKDYSKLSGSPSLHVTRGSQVYQIPFTIVNTEPTTAQNMFETLRGVALSINEKYTDAFTPLYPFYAVFEQNVDEELPSLRLVAMDYDTESMTLTASSTAIGEAFDPPLTDEVDDFGAVVSTQEVGENLLYYSKLEEPEAVPLSNQTPVGRKDSPILRIFRTPRALIILKEEGVFRLTGETEADFIVDEVDPSIRILVPDAAVALNNAVYCLSDQGIVRVDEIGVAIVSRPIEPTIRELLKLPNYAEHTFAISDEAERKYWLFHPTSEIDTHATLAHVYNHLTRTWVERTRLANAGTIHEGTGLLYLSEPTHSFVLEERDTGEADDYADEEIEITVNQVGTWNRKGVNLTRVRIEAPPAPFVPMPGALFRYESQEALVLTVEEVEGENAYDLFLFSPLSLPALTSTQGGYFDLLSMTLGTFVAAAGGGATTANFKASLLLGIESRVCWAPEVAATPDLLKDFSFAQISFERASASEHRMGFFTDMIGSEGQVTLSTFSNAWGFGSWGQFPWGGSGNIAPHIRTLVPTPFRKCRALSLTYEHGRARERFAILNVGYTFRQLQDRTTKVPA